RSDSTMPGSPSSPSTTAVLERAGGSRARWCASGTSSPTGRPRSPSPRPCREWTRPGSRSGASPVPAATSSASRRAPRPSAPRAPAPAAAIAQTPNVDGLAVARNAARYTTPLALLRLTGTGIADALGGLAGRRPTLVPLVGERGTVALLATPDALDGTRALQWGSRYPDWQQAAAARSGLRLGFYRPGRYASRVRCPLLVVVCDQDQTALPGPAAAAADRVPRGELVRLPGGHYQPFLGGHER